MARFESWTPDLPDKDSQGLTVCTNTYPDVGSYKSFAGPALFALQPLDSKCRGAFSFFSSDNLATLFAGTNNKLWRIGINLPIDVSNPERGL